MKEVRFEPDVEEEVILIHRSLSDTLRASHIEPVFYITALCLLVARLLDEEAEGPEKLSIVSIDASGKRGDGRREETSQNAQKWEPQG